ncbi:MAG: DUF2007 domain-containing protein [Planctomycetales bacterium]|nr:DUF2007 domain-containing protein [Planctomycetales bacterium]
MTYRDPKCVYVCDSPGNADVVANTLEHAGIRARVMDRATLGGLLGLTVWSRTGVSARGIEVWVLDEKDVPAALKLIEAAQEELRRKQQAKESLGPIDVTCEECGTTTSFPGKFAGGVQDCPKCFAYVDIPGDDEFDWPTGGASG